MTAAEWDASDDPTTMLTAAHGRIPDRPLLLFLCAAARRVSDRLPVFAFPLLQRVEEAADMAPPDRGPALREAVDAIGGLTGVVARGAILPDRLPATALQVAAALRWLESRPTDAAGTLLGRVFALVGALPTVQRPHPEQAALLRCLAGNPFRDAPFDPAWRTSDALSLARSADDNPTSDALPILADALQDAGCTDDGLLHHLRHDPTHARGCWAVARILDRR